MALLSTLAIYYKDLSGYVVKIIVQVNILLVEVMMVDGLYGRNELVD